MTRLQKLTVIAVAVLMTTSLFAMTGSVAGEESDDFDVEIEIDEDESVAVGENQTAKVTVTNLDEDSELTMPVVEIPLRGPVTVHEKFDGTDVDNPIDAATNIEEDETRSAYTDESTYRSSDAVYIEGIQVPPNDNGDNERTYTVNVSFESDGEQTVETNVFPLNNEDNRETAETDVDVEAFGTLDVTADDDQTVTVAGEEEFDGDFEVQKQAGDVDLAAEVDLIGELTIEDVTIPVESDVSATFQDVSEAESPEILGYTGSESTIRGLATPVDVGNATTPATASFDFLLETSTGDTHVAVETPDEVAPFDTIERELVDGDDEDIEDAGEAAETLDDASLSRISADEDTDVSITYQGYKLGDVTLDGDVTEADAEEIATRLAAGEQDQLNQYGDVTGDDEFSVADAMKIEQFAEDNRDADYELDLNGGA